MDKPANRMETDREKRMDFGIRDFTGPRCPNCGSTAVRTTRTEQKGDVTRERRQHCQKCPATWRTFETISEVDREPVTEPAAEESGAPEKN